MNMSRLTSESRYDQSENFSRHDQSENFNTIRSADNEDRSIYVNAMISDTEI